MDKINGQRPVLRAFDDLEYLRLRYGNEQMFKFWDEVRPKMNVNLPKEIIFFGAGQTVEDQFDYSKLFYNNIYKLKR